MLVPVREYANASEMLSTLLAIRRGFHTYERPVIVPPPPPVENVMAQPVRPTPKGPFGAYLFAIVLRVTVADVIKAVSAVWNIPPVHIVSARRTHDVLRPRQAVYALSCRLTTASLPQIGKAIGGRDHSTVFHGRNQTQPWLDAVEARIRPDAGVWEWAVELRKEME
jgi:hypothetical protein